VSDGRQIAGPVLPQPTPAHLDVGAALSGAYKLVPDQYPDLASALAHLLRVSPSEAHARFIAYADFQSLCWDIADAWSRKHGLTLVGIEWDGEGPPILHFDRSFE
jgi:hypothetical protein